VVSVTATTSSGATDSDTSGGGTSGGSGNSGGTTQGSASASGTTGGSGGPKFDLGVVPDAGGADDGGGQGCQKIDFLFVVDNSGSMAEEQAALAASFPGFIQSIQNTVMAQDYQIMVIDTDADATTQDCAIICTLLPTCGAYDCNNLPPPPSGCDSTLGAGLVNSPGGGACGVTGGNRYMLPTQPNLSTTFECLATVGTNGSGTELVMQSLGDAITTLNPAGQCNAGFVRPDAILVVTFITDEEDDAESAGDPASWKSVVVSAKGGDENAVVMLGLIGDPDQPNAVCTTEAEASPRLRTFAESFPYGSWGSICAADYAPFFDQAVMVIDSACDSFVPPG
jgi:hypothetical protein